MNSGDDPDLPEGGMLSTPYQTYADMPLHNVDSRIVSINYETGDFSFLIRKMHGDQVKSEEVDGVSVDISNHWMRYFLVLDPVGRVLAGRRRKAGEGELPGDDGKDWHKVSGSKDSIEEGKGISLTNAELNRFKDTLYAGEDENHIFGIGHTNLSIVDCPYVQVLTEDNKDAMARVTHRLR